MLYLVLALVVFIALILKSLSRKEGSKDNASPILASVSPDDDELSYEEPAPASDDSNVSDNPMPATELPPIDSLGLMKETLISFGCQPEIHDDGTLHVFFQGENFIMESSNVHVRIWDPTWTSIKRDDPNWPLLREALNKANFNFGPTIIYSEPTDEDIINIHSRLDIILHPSIPDLQQYIHSMLMSFFQTKNNLTKAFQELQASLSNPFPGHSSVGFSPSAN